jgi:hypothetical protein
VMDFFTARLTGFMGLPHNVWHVARFVKVAESKSFLISTCNVYSVAPSLQPSRSHPSPARGGTDVETSPPPSRVLLRQGDKNCPEEEQKTLPPAAGRLSGADALRSGKRLLFVDSCGLSEIVGIDDSAPIFLAQIMQRDGLKSKDKQNQQGGKGGGDFRGSGTPR